MSGDERVKAAGRYRVSVHNPWRYRIALVVLAALVWAGFVLGERKGFADRDSLGEEKAALLAEIKTLTRRNADLLASNARLERGSEIATAAYEEVKAELNRVQGEMVELQEELAFYRSVVSPSKAGNELRVQSFLLSETGRANRYRYSLVLTKSGKTDSYVQGNVALEVFGTRGGKSASLGLPALSPEAPEEPRFRFRFFQNLEGEVTLPGEFEPDEVEVSIKPTTKRVDPIQIRLTWAEAFAGGM